MYDALLGGAANFAVDRELAAALLEVEPQAGRWARANRAFLGRAVEFLLGEGVHQFIDLGSGLPTAGNVHEIVRAVDPSGRVVYVDMDPVAVAYGRQFLAGDEQAGVVHADITDVERVLTDPITQRFIDFSRPVGLLAVAVFHFVPGTDPLRVLDEFRAVLASGSYLTVSHLTTPGDMSPATVGAVRRYNTATTTPLTFRSRDRVTTLFAGWELLSPGVVSVDQWWPEPGDLEESAELGAVPGWAGMGRLARPV